MLKHYILCNLEYIRISLNETCIQSEYPSDPGGIEMASKALTQDQDSLLRAWSRKALLQRLLLPQDLMETHSPSEEETLVCQQTTNDYLIMSDRVEKKTVRTGDAKKYSTDISYRLQEFKNQTLKIFADSQKVTFDQCRGNRRVPCATKRKCSACGGSERRQETMTCSHTSSTPTGSYPAAQGDSSLRRRSGAAPARAHTNTRYRSSLTSARPRPGDM